jgi:hypothetical protein
VQAVHGFLQRCRTWALEQEIPRRLEQVAQTNDPAAAAKLHEWVAYLQFTEHALRELEQGTLDAWFTGEPSAQPPTQ